MGPELMSNFTRARLGASALLLQTPMGGGPAFRGLDQTSGNVLDEIKLNSVTSGAPVTYSLRDGNQ